MLDAVITLSLVALIAGVLLGLAYRSLPASTDALIEQVNGLLPQTQCAQCGYPGCRPYAAAVVDERAAINLCPPGGEATVKKLADLLGREPLALEIPAARRVVALIDEGRCIGCTHCMAACPVDAIIGAHLFMHTVIATECTGCELCVAPCPVDCISLQEVA